MKLAIVFRQLKTKCGSICACIASTCVPASSESWSCAESWSPSAPRSSTSASLPAARASERCGAGDAFSARAERSIGLVHLTEAVLAEVRARYGEPATLEWTGEISEREHALATYDPARMHDVTLFITNGSR